jgi:hypothetical protein
MLRRQRTFGTLRRYRSNATTVRTRRDLAGERGDFGSVTYPPVIVVLMIDRLHAQGLFYRDELLAAGYSRSSIRYRVQSGVGHD